MSARYVALLAIAVGGAVGCSAGDGGDGVPAACAFMDLCAQVPLARVAAVCGTSATLAAYDTTVGDPATVDACAYTAASSTVFEIDRTCSTVADFAQVFYNTAYDTALPLDFVRDDVSALGDSAFIRTSAQTMRAQLFVLHGNTVINLQDYEAPDAASVKACLTTLAMDVLAAR